MSFLYLFHMKINFSILFILFGLSVNLDAQYAGNSVVSRFNQPDLKQSSPGSWQMMPYNQPKGVPSNITMHSHASTPIRADVMMNVKATSFVAVFSLKFVARNVQESDSLMTAKLDALRSSLKGIGIHEKDVHIDAIGIHPESEFSEPENQRVGEVSKRNFSNSKNLHIRFNQPDQMDKIIGIAAKNEIYELVKVDYNVAEMDSIYEALRVTAERILQSKHDAFVRQGFTLEAQQFGSNQGAVYPFERYASYTSPSVDKHVVVKMEEKSRRKKAQVTPAIVREQAPKLTVYYERIPYHQFDLVLHEDMLEPCVQFYYALQVNYKIVLKDVDQREKEDRALDLALRRAEIKHKINRVGGNVNIEINTPPSSK